MNAYGIMLAGERLTALPSGALWVEALQTLAVADLHLGKAERIARLGGALLPPYETAETLARLEAEVARLGPKTLILLGDSFDDMAAAASLGEEIHARLGKLAAGREVVWITGNHDPGVADVPGSNLAQYRAGPLIFRHIAEPGNAPGEISGHYHPKARLRLRGQYITRPCFLADARRVILPAFGTYTGGLDITSPVLSDLMETEAMALLTGRQVTALPLPLPT